MKVRTPAKREAIVSAAAELFQELGYERASMNELVKRMGGSKATLYGYFPSKEDLFAAVVRSIATSDLSNATIALQQAIQRNANMRDALTQFGAGLLQVLANDRSALAIYRMVMGEAGRSEVGKAFYEAGPAGSLKLLAELLKVFMDRGELREADPHVCALQLTALVTAEVNPRLYQRDPAKVSKANIQRMSEHAVGTFLFGVAPRN